MFISLETIICYIDSYAEAYFDPFNYTCFYEFELSEGQEISVLMKLPKTEEIEIVCDYIEQKKDRLFQYQDGVKTDLNLFYKLINKHGLYEEWCEFRWQWLMKFAAEWCEENSIIYTKKKESN